MSESAIYISAITFLVGIIVTMAGFFLSVLKREQTARDACEKEEARLQQARLDDANAMNKLYYELAQSIAELIARKKARDDTTPPSQPRAQP